MKSAEEILKNNLGVNVVTHWKVAMPVTLKGVLSAMDAYASQFTPTDRLDEEIYVPVSIEDRSEPMPKDGNCILLFDDGSARHFFDEDLPFAVATHWLKRTTLRELLNNK